MYYIEVKKDNIPYKTQVVIKDKIFYFSFKYNMYDNRVYCDLLDVNENILVEDEPLVLGQMMFARYYIDAAGNFKDDYLKAVIIPNFEDVGNRGVIDYSNLNDVQIYIQEIDNV